jgi:hypothetical protein
VDARRAAKWVLDAHPPDQRAQFRSNARRANSPGFAARTFSKADSAVSNAAITINGFLPAGARGPLLLMGVNTITREGLAEALADAQVVVDVANLPSFEDQAVLEFFETSGRNLLAAEAAAGVGHHVALSVVGTDRLLESGYFRGKMAQEHLIKASRIPYTILRSTQFFEFVSGIAQSSTVGHSRCGLHTRAVTTFVTR